MNFVEVRLNNAQAMKKNASELRLKCRKRSLSQNGTLLLNISSSSDTHRASSGKGFRAAFVCEANLNIDKDLRDDIVKTMHQYRKPRPVMAPKD